MIQVGPEIPADALPAVIAALKTFFRIPVYYRVWLDERGTYARIRL